MPPSTSILALPTSGSRQAQTLSGEPAMKAWPPQPGLTVMQRTMSASPRSSATASTGVPGLIAMPARQPSSRIAASVRLACGVASCVEGDRVGTGLGEGLDLALGRLDHQVDVDRPAGGVDLIGDRGGDQRPDRDRRHEMPVHHVEVDHPRAGLHHLVDLGAEPEKSAERIDGATRG